MCEKNLLSLCPLGNSIVSDARTPDPDKGLLMAQTLSFGSPLDALAMAAAAESSILRVLLLFPIKNLHINCIYTIQIPYSVFGM